MKNLIKQKVFIGAFLTTYFLFFVVTVIILEIQKPGVGIGHTEYGFPFTYYYSHCFGGYYLWTGLIGNCLVAAGFSLIVGLISTFFWLNWILPLWQMVSSPEFRAKWYI